MEKKLNERVQEYWEVEPCGSSPDIVGDLTPLTHEWFEVIETHRYNIEPYIHSVAQFTRHRGKRVLEIGVGAGTDHLQWARAGTDLYGVDLTAAGIKTTRARLENYNLTSNLQKVDAEVLPFEDNFFDIVYSWGVIHHSEKPEKIIEEILRVLKKDGQFIGMFYQRPSLVTYKVWVQNALFKAKPWLSLKNVLFNNVESIGTKAYTINEMKKLFEKYSEVEVIPIMTEYDTRKLPNFITKFLPSSLGWFLAIRAKV
jgi:ubiquinone/menaquinone biosynthesis C-methylase UbiE